MLDKNHRKRGIEGMNEHKWDSSNPSPNYQSKSMYIYIYIYEI